MQYYDFSRLIGKYSTEYTLITPTEGSWQGGHYVNGGEVKETRTGAIIALPLNKIQQSGGYYTAQDRNLYSTTPIEGALTGCKVLHDRNIYSIETDAQNGNERFTGVYSYVLKRVIENV